MQNIHEALADTPVILLNGARQTGKSTLLESLVTTIPSAQYVTLDDATALASAHNNPEGFLAGFNGLLALDEIQRAPELFLPLKREVDKNRKPGRFLLSGSANMMLLPKLSESLAGRMEIQTLFPFSQGELAGHSEHFLDSVFAQRFPHYSHKRNGKETLAQKMIIGGFPEVQLRKDDKRRNAWFKGYITTILQRDVRDISNIDGLTELPKLLSLLAARMGTILNFAELSRSAAIPQTTLKRYLTLLQMTFLVQLLPAWSGNLGKRLIKTPKIYLVDTGLVSHLLELNTNRLLLDGTLFGHLLENFILLELCKQSMWNNVKPALYYLRTDAGQEIDFIIEHPDGRIAGIEVKATHSVSADAFKGMNFLAEKLGKKFQRGIVLYLGTDVIPFGKNLHAMPFDVVWKLATESNKQRA
jgi:predicted AAA+ superfamily ATPase